MMKIDFFGKTDIGRVRKTNEDYFLNKKLNDNEHLFIVADGMGGHQAGEVASRLGTDTFVKEYQKMRTRGKPVEESMIKALKKANASILKRAISDPQKRGMGTTFTGCVIHNQKATIIHVGDSRIYLIRGNEIRKITTDHTFVEKMLKEGKISEEEARDHPQKNILYMSLGARDTYIPEIITNLEIQDGDIITLCSDGLNNMVSDEEIKEYALAYDPEKSVKELIRLANENGGMDNVTVQIIHTGETSKHRTGPIRRVENRHRLMVISLTAVVFAIGLISIWLFRSPRQESGKIDITRPSFMPRAALATETASQSAISLEKFPTTALQDLEVSARDIIDFSAGRLVFRQDSRLILYSIQSGRTSSWNIDPSETWIPSSAGRKTANPDGPSVFFLKRIPTHRTQYNVYEASTNQRVFSIQSDNELNSIDFESRTIKFVGLSPPLQPICISSRVFVFCDPTHHYVIENPMHREGELKPYRIETVSDIGRSFFDLREAYSPLQMLSYDQSGKSIKLYDIPSEKLLGVRKIIFNITEDPLGIESLSNLDIGMYFTFGRISIRENNSFSQCDYSYDGSRIMIDAIWIDMFSSRRIVRDSEQRLFLFDVAP